MAKYAKYQKSPMEKPRPWEIHPIWRGIGCFLLIIIPLMSYAGAHILVEMNAQEHWMPAPYGLMRPVSIPLIGLLIPAWGKPIPHLFANLLVAGLLSLLGFAAFATFYAIIYSVAGPPRYGPLDAPPITPQRQRRKR